MIQNLIDKINKINKNQDGISSLEMLYCSLTLIAFIMFVFITASAYWNKAILNSTSQNAALTANFMTVNASGHNSGNLPNCVLSNNTSNDNVSPICANSNEDTLNPIYAVNQIAKESTGNLLSVPMENSSFGCNRYMANNDPENNSSEQVTATTNFAQATNTTTGVRTTTAQVNLSVPWAPLPLPSFNNETMFEGCANTFNIVSNGYSQSFTPPAIVNETEVTP